MGGCEGWHVLGRIGWSIRDIIARNADDPEAPITKIVAKLADRIGKMYDERAVITKEHHQ
tara:strand:+ start:51 stop:230 length:180 start_codon:yes stop_codon:yes gene_type:complete